MAVRNIDVRPSLLQLLIASLLLCWATLASAQDWTYRARPGDTLWDLSARYLKANVQWQQLQAHNKVTDPYRLPPGQTLRFPIAWLRVQPAPARVVALRGQAQVSDPLNGTRPLQANMLLPIGSQLQTGDDASVTLSFADNSRLQLRENSLLQLDQLSSYGATGMVDTRMRLQRGRSSNQVTPARGPASRYIITAPTATSSVRGTLFRVNAGDRDSPAATEVVEGRVQVGNRAGQRVIGGGHATLIRAAGSAPAQPQPLLPAPQLVESQLRLQPLPLLATWQALDAARRYRVEVVLAAAPDVVLFAREVAEPQIQIDSLPPGQLRLLVRAIDADDVEGLDARHDFLVPEGLPAPLTLAPLHGQTVHQPQPRFQWAKVAGATGSVLQIADNPNFLQPLIEQQTSNQQLRIRNPLPAGDYYWRLASLDADNTPGRYGQTLPLQISDVPVATPLDSAKDDKGLLTLRWPADSGAQHYRVQISRKADFSRLLLDQQVDIPEIAFKQPWRGGTLHVRVQSIEDDGYAATFSAPQQIQLRCRLCYGLGAGALLLLAL